MAVLVFLATMVLFIMSGDTTKPASDYFPICHLSDPDLNKCVKNVVETIRPLLTKGIPELKVVSLEPLVVPRMEYSEGGGNFKLHQVSTNVKIHGLSKYVVRSVKVDLDNLKLDMDLFTPYMRMEFDYEIDGRILLLPIQGNGDGVFNFTDVTTLAHTVLHKVQRKGEEYLDVESIKWDIDFKNASLQFNNLFNGDKNLGKAMNDFLNENWQEAMKTYKYIPEQAFGEVIKDISSKVYKTYPFKELFPK